MRIDRTSKCMPLISTGLEGPILWELNSNL